MTFDSVSGDSEVTVTRSTTMDDVIPDINITSPNRDVVVATTVGDSPGIHPKCATARQQR